MNASRDGTSAKSVNVFGPAVMQLCSRPCSRLELDRLYHVQSVCTNITTLSVVDALISYMLSGYGVVYRSFVRRLLTFNPCCSGIALAHARSWLKLYNSYSLGLTIHSLSERVF